MIDLIFLIIGIIGLIISVIYIACNYKGNSECWPAYFLLIMPFIFVIIISLSYGEQCINCGEVYAKYKVCCPRCGSHESTEIKDNEGVNINSVDVNCNEFNIHKNEKQNTCDEETKQWTCECGRVNEESNCHSCGKQKVDKLQEKQDTKKWICECGQVNTGDYCSSCGKEKVDKIQENQNTKQWTCECGQVNTGNYCQNCGNQK